MLSLAKPWGVACLSAALVILSLGCRDSSPPAPPAPSSAPQPASSATGGSQPAVPDSADSPALTIGSPAPPLTIQAWVAGEPIAQLQAGQIYVVEFWATWCGPCRLSMPHISLLQKKYGPDVVFIGVTREPEDTVREFLAKEQSPGKTWAEVVQYRLAVDSADATSSAYMKAAEQSSIPTAFLVGADGVVEWIGHPGSIDEPLAKVAAGTWDRQAAGAEFHRTQQLRQLSRQTGIKVRAKEWDQALQLLDSFQSQHGLSPEVSRLRLSVLQKAGRNEEAAALQAEMVQQSWDDAGALNEIAWGIAISDQKQALQLALKAANRASELRSHEDAEILDTLARVHYQLGQLDEAIGWQNKAVQHSQGNPSVAATLKKYEAEKAPPAD